MINTPILWHSCFFFFFLFLKAVDPDTVKAITYKFLTGDVSKFTIGSNGLVSTNANLDYEEKQRYILTVTTNEGENGGLSSTSTITINVVVS